MEWLAADVMPWSITAFLICFLCSQRLSHVLTLDALLTFITTTWITLSARDWLTSVATEQCQLDALHDYLLCHVLLVQTVPALVWFLSTDPGDITIRTALSLSRIVGFGTATVTTAVSYHEDMLFDPKAFHYMALILFSISFIFVAHLFYHNTINADKRQGNLNYSLYIDLCMGLVCGTTCLCFPQLPANYLFDQDLDQLHAYLYRLYGCMTLGYCCLPYFAPRFRTSANKRAILFSRALSMMVMLLVTFRKYRNGDIPDGLGGKLMVASLIIFTMPSAIGSMRHEYVSGWDLPWRGLRVPHVAIGGSPTQNFLLATKNMQKMAKGSPKKLKKMPKSRRSRHRKSRSRARPQSKKR